MAGHGLNFWRKLRASITQRDSLLCVGLDPDPKRILHSLAEGFRADGQAVVDFNKLIVDTTADIACAYKPNIAFYEALGEEGLAALAETLRYVPTDIPVILDAKRSDIASTAAAYARAVYEVWGAGAVTVNPYLGRDGVWPFLEYENRGVFLLCKTSNPSAGEVQDWSQAGKPLYQRVAELAACWAGEREIGLVMGASYPEAIAHIRSQWPQVWFLIPGVGAQGGDLRACLQAGLQADGLGVIINSSRGIMYAEDPRKAALALRDQINALRDQIHVEDRQEALRKRELLTLARALFEAGCVQFGDFVLHSGAHSPIYIDLRRLVTYPALLSEVARHYVRLLKPLHYQRLAAIPYAALPIGTAVALQVGVPLLYPRREAKSYGTRRAIEGEYRAGERVVLLDDLITSGESKLEALEPLLQAGLVIKDVVVLIDREQGGAQELGAHGYRLHAVATLREIVDALAEERLISLADAQRVHRYLMSGSKNGG